MSQQKSLNAFFNVRKRAADQHAAKRRKVILDDPETANSLPKTAKTKGDVSIKEVAKVVKASQPAPENGESSSSVKLTSIKDDATDQVCATPVVTSVFDDHIVRPELATPKSSNAEAKNSRHRKRDVHGEAVDSSQQKTGEQVLFTVGKRTTTTAKKRLDLAKETKKAQGAKVVSFLKLGQLSPAKKPALSSSPAKPLSPAKNVVFEKLGPLSPAKKPVTSNDLSDLKARASRLRSSLAGDGSEAACSKLTPDQIKSKLGTVTKLSDLQAKLKSLNEKSAKFETPATPAASHRRALFSTPQATSRAPKLSQTPVTLDIVKEPVIKPPPSPIKASPRKAVIEATVVKNLPQPDVRIPLPRKYKFLAEVFDILEKIVGMKHNRREIIRVEDVKPLVQNVLRRSFNDDHLRQIRCVFPRAFNFFWERKKDRMNRETSNFELHIEINHDYDKVANGENLDKRKTWEKITPAAQVERLRVFKHNLLTIVQDHHRAFLSDKGINLTTNVTSWHEDFDVEALPDIDSVDFPPKPFVEVVKSAPEMIKRLESLFNPRLENVLQQRAAAADATAAPAPAAASTAPAAASATPTTAPQEVKPETTDGQSDVKILKGLQGLSPAILAMIKAKEQARQIKKMTQTSEEQKELELMEELITVSSIIVNCHRSRRNGAAVPSETLYKVTADSYGRKAPAEMEQLVRLFVRLVPECMEFKTYEKVEYIKLKKPGPDNNQIREKLERLVKEKKIAL